MGLLAMPSALAPIGGAPSTRGAGASAPGRTWLWWGCSATSATSSTAWKRRNAALWVRRLALAECLFQRMSWWFLQTNQHPRRKDDIVEHSCVIEAPSWSCLDQFVLAGIGRALCTNP